MEREARREELREQLEAEINETERRLSFWRQQDQLHADSEVGIHIREIVDGYDRQLEHLNHARQMLDA